MKPNEKIGFRFLGSWRLLGLAWITPACLLAQSAGPIEPDAGKWKTWVISSGRDFRVPPPPDAAATKGELDWLKSISAEQDPRITQQIQHWDAGPPVYRWIDELTNRWIAGTAAAQPVVRGYVYVAQAVYDATIATWDSKYAYNRARPSVADAAVKPRIAVPNSPSYPSEHAAAAAAAAEVLAYLIPAEAAYFRSAAEEAGRSRLYAGVEYPSDYSAGMELGRKVAAEVIAKARLDGSDVPWTGTIPTGQCMWVGTNPGNANAATWKPILLSSPSEFRPPPPPSCTSAQVQAEVAAVRDYPRSPAAFNTNSRAFYWQSNPGTHPWAHIELNRWVLEDRTNAPRAARAYALLGVAAFDSFIASQDGKFAYWYLRPHMLDPRIVPLFAAPNFPSYPSNHSTFSAARGDVMAYLYPNRAGYIQALAKEAGDSRIWAGIHYEIDNESGVTLGKRVAQKVIDWASKDGSQ